MPTAVIPIPIANANTMRGSISAFAIVMIGLDGIIPTKTSIKPGASLISGAFSATKSIPKPGCKTEAKPRAMIRATAVVTKYNKITLIPMRPSFFVSPRLATPQTKDANTTGTIIILIRLMNIVPNGAR